MKSYNENGDKLTNYLFHRLCPRRVKELEEITQTGDGKKQVKDRNTNTVTKILIPRVDYDNRNGPVNYLYV